MKQNNRRAFTFLIIVITFCCRTESKACFAYVAGAKATVDGSVLLGHVEQNRGSLFVNFRVVPRITNPPGSFFVSQNGAKIPNAPQSWSYLWSQLYGGSGSDALLNEWGVACVSDGTHSKDENPEPMIVSGDITDGGLSLELRLEVAKKARSAREGVLIIGSLIEKFGYCKSGTTHVVADPTEAWIVTVIMGKRWIARRVPDDEVVVLANVNIITEFDFNDTVNYLASPDIVEYAVRGGWYNPKKDKVFNFKKAYDKVANDPVSVRIKCDARQWRGQCLVTGTTIKLPAKSPLPFSVKPARKLSVADLRRFLSDHAEGSELDRDRGYSLGSPHDVMEYYDGMVCNDDNQELAVFQLRSGMPREIGCIYWRTTCAGCTGVLLPWYLGIAQTPDYYYRYSDTTTSMTMEFHYNPPVGATNFDDSKAFCIYNQLENLVDTDYKNLIGEVLSEWNNFENDLFDFQPAFEETALSLYHQDKGKCREYLTGYCHRNSLNALVIAKEMIQKINNVVLGF